MTAPAEAMGFLKRTGSLTAYSCSLHHLTKTLFAPIISQHRNTVEKPKNPIDSMGK